MVPLGATSSGSTTRSVSSSKTVAGVYYDADPSPLQLRGRHDRPGLDDGHLRRRNAVPFDVAGDQQRQDRTITTSRASIATTGVSPSNIPPDASAIRLSAIDSCTSLAGRARRATACCLTSVILGVRRRLVGAPISRK